MFLYNWNVNYIVYMNGKPLLCLIVITMIVPFAKGTLLDTILFRDVSTSTTTGKPLKPKIPIKQAIRKGVVVLIDGYQMGMSVIALASGLSSAKRYPHTNPLSGYFYTNVYRWALRHLSLLPKWISGKGGSYCETHKVWKRRFFYMNEFIPKWMRKLFPYIKDEEWDQEEKEFKLYKKFSEPGFGKHYRFPSKIFNNFQSQETTEDFSFNSSSDFS